MKYRIVKNGFEEYRIWIKFWWWPFWVAAREYSSSGYVTMGIIEFQSYGSAETWIRQDLKRRKAENDGWKVVREIGPINIHKATLSRNNG